MTEQTLFRVALRDHDRIQKAKGEFYLSEEGVNVRVAIHRTPSWYSHAYPPRFATAATPPFVRLARTSCATAIVDPPPPPQSRKDGWASPATQGASRKFPKRRPDPHWKVNLLGCAASR